MILVVDVGNTNTEVGAFEGDELICSWRLMTKTPRTSDEFAVAFRGFFQTDDLNVQDVTAIVVASVVPNIMHSMTNGIKKVFQMTPMTVGPGIKTGMPIFNQRSHGSRRGPHCRCGGGLSALRRAGARAGFRHGDNL